MIARHIIRRSYSIRFPEHIGEVATKPKISEFKTPLLNTFLIASSTCLVFHSLWLSLEYVEREKELSARAKVLENEIQSIVDVKKEGIVTKKWYWLWR
jgi:hypothetical protein